MVELICLLGMGYPHAGSLWCPQTLVGCLLSDDSALWLCLHTLGWDRQWILQRDSGSGLWPPYATGCHECSSCLSPTVLAVTLLLWVGRFCRLWCPGGCASLLKTSASANVDKGSIACLSSHTHSANWHGSPDIGGEAFSTQCCHAFAYARVFCGCFIQ